MKVLLLGSGGRESALAWGLTSTGATELVAAPGNPGIARRAEVEDVDPCDGEAVVALARRRKVDLVVVGPEAPLVAGVADAVRAAGVPVFGPGAAAARIEGSKTYAKELMEGAGIPTARWGSFDDIASALSFLDEVGPPYVVKADGLASGKGVVVTEDRAEAAAALTDRLSGRAFGAAGRTVVIEEFLDGEEASLIGFCDGARVVPCEPAQDYKRLGDADRGPNTGGMGSYSPVPACPPGMVDELVETVLQPMLEATARAGAPFVGALYAGLALTSAGPRVVEFNARFGDPETQALLPRLGSDLADVCLAAATGDLAGVKLAWRPEACVSVVLSTRGYPGSPRTGDAIEGLDPVEEMDDVLVFHAGTALVDGILVTAGGRVLAVSAVGPTFRAARDRAYAAAEAVRFEGRQMRKDIALRALRSEEEED